MGKLQTKSHISKPILLLGKLIGKLIFEKSKAEPWRLKCNTALWWMTELGTQPCFYLLKHGNFSMPIFYMLVKNIWFVSVNFYLVRVTANENHNIMAANAKPLSLIKSDKRYFYYANQSSHSMNIDVPKSQCLLHLILEVSERLSKNVILP